MSSVYQAASNDRGKSNLFDSEYSPADWERGETQSFSLFQDHRILSHRWANWLCLEVPELEPYADSL